MACGARAQRRPSVALRADSAAGGIIPDAGRKNLERNDAVELPLACLVNRAHAALPNQLDDLEWRGADRDLFGAICDELGVGDDTRQRPHRWLP